MRQFELWWADLPEPIGIRPVLLLSRDAAYEYLNRVLAVEVTRRMRGIPQEIALGAPEGMTRRCVANLDNLRSVPKGALRDRIGQLPQRRFIEVKRALGFTLGWIALMTT